MMVCASLSACAGTNGYTEPEERIDWQKPPEAIWLGEQPQEDDGDPHGQEPGDVPGEQGAASGEGGSHTANEQMNESAYAFWDQFTGVWLSDYSFHAELPGDQAYEYVITGLTHDDPGIRWYCAYRLLDWLPQADSSDMAHMVQALLPLLLDEQPFVQQAASLVLDVAAGRLSADSYDVAAASADGLQQAFYRFAQSRFNDGNVYVWSADRGLRSFEVDGSVSGLTWSPDGKLLGISYGGRIWGSISLYDAVNGTFLSMPDLVKTIATGESYGYQIDWEQIPRVDPYVLIAEWSPDSDKILFTYEFSDMGYAEMTYEGYGVYNIAEERIETIYPSYSGKPDWLGNG